jgi:hypothetical protein
MSRTERFALLVVAIVAVMVAFVLLRPNDSDHKAAAVTAAPAAAPSVTRATTSTSAGSPPSPRAPALPVLRAGSVETIQVVKGATVRFAVRSTTDEEVHVHGYDLANEAPAGRTIRMSFKASIEGIFEVEFEHSGTEIAKLRVEP